MVDDLKWASEAGVSGTADTAPWSIEDPPLGFVGARLRAIVRVQLNIDRIEGKRKLS